MSEAALLGSPVAHDAAAGMAAAAMAQLLGAGPSGLTPGATGALLAGGAIEPLGGLAVGGGQGVVVTGSPDLSINDRPAGRVLDAVSCHTGEVIAAGSASVIFNGLPAARVGDPTTGGAVIIGGSPNVFIGGPGAGAPDFPCCDVGTQIRALLAASAQGKPFCEQCQRGG